MVAPTDEEKKALSDMILGGDASGFNDLQDSNEVVDDSVNETSEEEYVEEEENVEEEEVQEPAFDAKAELALLKQQINQQTQAPALTQEQEKLISMGQQIQQLQNQNMPLYNKMIQFAQDEISGNAAPQVNPIQEKINTFKNMIKSDKYKEMDTAPFEQMVEMLEVQMQQNEQAAQVNNTARQQLQTQLQTLDGYRTQSEEQKQDAIVNKQLLDLSSAEKDFGVKIENGSRRAKQMVALVQGGESVRGAYLLVTGKNEKQKIAKKKSKPITTSNGKVGKPSKDDPTQKALRKHLFGDGSKKNSAGIVYT